jgi:hypothetical protein
MQHAQMMLEERVRGGLSGLDDAQVKLTSDGFVFAGEPITPPRHWENLVADLTPHQVQAAKKLAGDRT